MHVAAIPDPSRSIRRRSPRTLLSSRKTNALKLRCGRVLVLGCDQPLVEAPRLVVRDAVSGLSRGGVSLLLLRLLRDIVYMPNVSAGRKENGAIPDNFRRRIAGTRQTPGHDVCAGR